MGDSQWRRTLLVGLALSLLTMGGCRDALGDGATPRLLVPSDAVLGQLKAAWDDAGRRPTEAPRGAEGFASGAEIAAFERACEAQHADVVPASPPQGDPAGQLTGGSGTVWRGSGPTPELGPPPAGADFAWVEGDVEFLDPNRVTGAAGAHIASNLFEGLLGLPPGNGPPVPGQAERYEVSPDGRVYTFHLREGLVWSDGVPITAEDFRYSLLRGLNPRTASRNAQQVWMWVEGARDYNAGKTADPATVGVRVKGARTLEIELETPAPFFPHLVAYIAYAPVPRHAIEAHGRRWTRPEHVVVNGAYRLSVWAPRERLELVKNPRYWDAANVAIERAVVHLSDDEERNVRLYETGQVHVATTLPPDKVREWIRQDRGDLRIDRSMCTYYYVLRVDRPPFDQLGVRRAFNAAIDKERATRHLIGGFRQVATSLLPDMFGPTLGYRPAAGDAYDPALARQLLAEAGFPSGGDLPATEVIYNTLEYHRLIAQFVQRSLREHLDVDVTISNLEWKSLLKRLHAGDYQVARTSWCADYPDPFTFLQVFASDSEANYAGYRNPAYDGLLTRIRAETDPRRRNVLMCAAEETLNRDLPLITIFHYTTPTLIRSFVKGHEPHYRDHHSLKHIRIEP